MINTCKHGNTGRCELCEYEDEEHDATMAEQAFEDDAQPAQSPENKSFPVYELKFIMRVLGHKGQAPREDWDTAYGMAKQIFEHWCNANIAQPVQTAARLAVEKERERIADLWAGCTTEAEGHGLVDIGASIRAGKLVDEA